MTKRLVALGNIDRGDDGAGWLVGQGTEGWDVDYRMAGSFELIDDWGPDDDVVIVDAMRSGADPGSIHRFDGLSANLPRGAFTSTHSFGPVSLIDLAKVIFGNPNLWLLLQLRVAMSTITMRAAKKTIMANSSNKIRGIRYSNKEIP